MDIVVSRIPKDLGKPIQFELMRCPGLRKFFLATFDLCDSEAAELWTELLNMPLHSFFLGKPSPIGIAKPEWLWATGHANALGDF